MLTIVKRNEGEFADWLKTRHAEACNLLAGYGLKPDELLSTEVGWLMCLPKYREKFLEFDPFQFSFLLDRSRKRSINKARQIGFSFVIASESLARCHLKATHTAVCVSYNLDDAKVKIASVKELHDQLPLEYQKKLVIDRETKVSFRSVSSKRQLSSVISYPSKAPRGKSGDVYLDELAHCHNDEAIFAGSTALIVRSGGQLTIGSTPLGQRGVFYNIHAEPYDKKSGWSRWDIPWWLCRMFSKISFNEEAIRLCAATPTAERVLKWGTPAIIEQFETLSLSQFQQEFELAFQDEKVSFFPLDTIQACATKEAREIPIYDNLEQLAAQAHKLNDLCVGLDIGVTNHPSELWIVEKDGPGFIPRYRETYKNTPFPKQRERLIKILKTLDGAWSVMRLDETGLGKDMTQSLQQVFGRRKVLGVAFSMKSKERLANNFKILLQDKEILLPRDRELINQIHSIKQKITASGNAIFDSDKNSKTHADKFWALAMACHREPRKRRVGPGVIGVRTLGGKREDQKTEIAPKQDPHAGILERIFDVKDNDSTPPQGVRSSAMASARPLTRRELAQRGREILKAIRIWRQSGDSERVENLKLEYKRLRSEAAKLSGR